MYVLSTPKRKYEEFVVIEDPTTTPGSLSPITKPQYKLYISHEITTECIDNQRQKGTFEEGFNTSAPPQDGNTTQYPSSKHRIKCNSHFLRRATTQIARATLKTEHLNSNHLSSKVPHSR